MCSHAVQKGNAGGSPPPYCALPAVAACRKAAALDQDIRQAEATSAFGVGRGFGARRPLSIQDCHNSAAALQTLPDTTQQQLFKTFLTGYKGEELGVQC